MAIGVGLSDDELQWHHLEEIRKLRMRVSRLEAFVSKVANWKFEGDHSVYGRMDNDLASYYHVKSEVEAAQAEALALLEP